MGDSKRLIVREGKVMKALWRLKSGAVSDVLQEYCDPKPQYTTIATHLPTLERKGIVKKRKIGNVNVYSPILDKNQYIIAQLNYMATDYYTNAHLEMALLLIHNLLSEKEIEQLSQQINKPKGL